MGNVFVQAYTSEFPYTLMGVEAGVCVKANLAERKKNQARGKECLNSEHGRVLEYVQVYLVLDGYSARAIREFYTHIGGMPTRLQESTRYIKYEGFDYVIPSSIENNEETKKLYTDLMEHINTVKNTLVEKNIPLEDTAMVLPLGMSTKVVVRTNLRQLQDMMHTRLCTRAYWEMRQMMKDIKKALSEYSAEWKDIVETCFIPKCEYYGYCTEKKSCKKKPNKFDFIKKM